MLPECLNDFVADDNPVTIIEAFVEELELESMGFDGITPSTTGRPSYHPAVLLKIYIYGYLNRVQSSRRLERECQRNVELMWLTGRLAPDFKTIADFRRDNGTGIRNVCRRFVVLCRDLKLFSQALVAIDGSKFKASNTRDRNFTTGKIDKRQQQIEETLPGMTNTFVPLDNVRSTVSPARSMACNCIATGAVAVPVAISNHNVPRAIIDESPGGNMSLYWRPPSRDWTGCRMR